ncbi:MAG: outer membrane protein transport protein [Deltaproteobacteria bacterium]|nr:outer membrane protein transport protein [Deltaproteobacteria bacterium]
MLLLSCTVSTTSHATQVGSIFSGPASADALVSYYNPAGMTLLSKTHGVVFGAASFLRLQYQRSSPSLLDGSIYPQAEVFVTKPAPALGFVTDAGSKRWRLGLSVSLPLLEGGSWAETYEGRPASTRYFALQARLGKFLISPAVAYKITPWLSVGAGLDVIGVLLSHEAFIDFGARTNQLLCKTSGYDQCQLDSPFRREDPHYQGLTTIDGIGFSVGVNAGILLTPRDDLRFGFGIHSGGPVTIPADIEVHVPASIASYMATHLASIELPELKAKGDVALRMPLIFTAGVWWRVRPRLQLAADLHFMRTSDTQVMVGNITETSSALIGDQVLIKGRGDAMLFGLRGSYLIGEKLRVALRVEYDVNTRPERFVSPISIDFHRISLHAGLTWAITKHIGLTLEVAHYLMFSHDVRMSTFAPNALPTTAAEEGLDKPSPTGTYSAQADRVGLGLSFRF